MYVWEILEKSCFDGNIEHTLIKDDDEALDKVKKEVVGVLYYEIAECEDRIGGWDGVSTQVLDNTQDWLESIKNKLSEVERYEFISQFKKIELFGCTIYVNKVEVI